VSLKKLRSKRITPYRVGFTLEEIRCIAPPRRPRLRIISNVGWAGIALQAVESIDIDMKSFTRCVSSGINLWGQLRGADQAAYALTVKAPPPYLSLGGGGGGSDLQS
jgi:hypothetical protein